MRRSAFVAAVALALAAGARAATVPQPVLDAVHGRAAGWTRSADGAWFVVYLDRTGRGWCGLQGASWRMALVETRRLPVRVVADRRVAGAMCGNALDWVRAGRFSDGRHPEVAFMLWSDPALGATTSVYRLGPAGFTPLASFAGDRVVLGAGRVTVSFENRGLSPHGELEDVYRFVGGRYRLVARR